MNIVIFEDEFNQNLTPLSLLKPVYDIRTGVFTNSERLIFLFGNKYTIRYHCREVLSEYVSEIKNQQSNVFNEEDTLFLNGRVIFTKPILEKLINVNNEFILKFESSILAAFLKAETISKFNSVFKSKNKSDYLPFLEFVNQYEIEVFNDKLFGINHEKDFFVIKFVWDIVKYFNSILNNDLELLTYSIPRSNILEYKLINPEQIYIANSVNILPYSVLDASAGRIFIDNDVLIEPFSYIKGPVYIGSKSIIKSGTKIYGPVSIGFNSRIAGEISGTIFHSFVNKQHDGFIGNSYVAEFVNLGADTVTSNLKNNYSPIKVRFQKGSIQHQTGMTFLGSIIGDHTKTGINTMLNTGSIIGIFALIAGGGFPDKFIDSFSWYITGKAVTTYKIEEALQTAKIVMSRRQQELSPAYEKLIIHVYNSLVNLHNNS
ncbi:MAG: putative sugar nucleotidyl transferase [Ignavibacteria bacterium]|nr:putative sugar nucleotidyl transferase [Ignavibacteria bacterium]